MDGMVRAADLRELSQGERFVLFLFVVLPGNHTAACVSAYAQAATGRPLPLPMLRGAMDGMVGRGFFEEGVAARNEVGRAYRLAAGFTLKGLRQLAEDANRHAWWPTPEVLGRGLAGSWLGAELAYAVRNFVTPMHIWQVCEALRGLLAGGDCGAYGVPPGAGHALASVHWTACARVLDLVRGEAFVPAEDLSPRAVEALLPVLFEISFVRGRDVRPALEVARRLLLTPRLRASSSFLCAYCALCVWTARRDLLNGIASAVPRGSPAEVFAGLCTDVFEGRFAEAEKAFASGADTFRGVLPGDVSTPVWLLGIALALRVGAPLPRLGKYARELKAGPADPLHWHPAGRSALNEAVDLRSGMVERAMCAGTEGWKPGVPAAYDAARPLETAGRDLLAGYPTLAAVDAAAVRRRFPDAAHLEELEAALAKQGAVPLVKRVVREPVWKTALRELSECLPAHGAAKGEQALSGTIGWLMAFTSVPCGDETLCLCERLVPVYRGPRGAEDGSDDKRLTLKGLAAAKYRACLTSCDAEVLQCLLKGAYSPKVAYAVPEEALELLCGHPRLFEGDAGSELKDGEPRRPVALERRPCEMTTEKGPAGEMRLVLPKWMLAPPRETHAIRREAPGRYVYHALPKKVRDVAEVFRRRGTDGALVVPAPALDEARGVLERLAGTMSIAGAFAVDGGGFTRVAGDPAPCVRLVYANEELSLALVVTPLPNRAVAACEPGVGLPERLVQLRGGKTVLLARDLAAEEAAAARVRAALAPFDAWATAKNRWLVKSAEEALDALRALMALEGVRLEWPEGEKVRVAAPAAGGVRIEAAGEDWFSVGGEVELDNGRVVELMALLRALANREGNYVRFGENDYVYLSGELLRRMEALATACGPVGASAATAEVPDAALPMLAKAFADAGDGLPPLPEAMAKRAEGIDAAFAEKVAVPRRFKGTLRPYQEEGYAWLEHLAACGFGACLADDMGLGKTVQVIALLLKRAAEGPSLVVAPASVCVNWVRELGTFAPSLRPVTLWGDRDLASESVGKGDVVVASYGLLVSRAADFEQVAWNGVVLDEAQAVKNAATQRAHVAKNLRAKFRVAATGTPVENHLGEFWSIFSFLNPRLLGSQKDFEARFTEAGYATPLLKRLVEPFLLRRLKRTVLKELPPKTEVTLRVELEPAERAAYEACRREALASLAEKGQTENRISVLAALTRLRRFCCHPSLVIPDQVRSAKLDAVLELLGDLREAGHRALVFSQFTDYLAIVREAVESRKWTYRYLDGSTPAAERAEAVDAFQRGDGDFFLISLKAGGTGLNLTAANFVLLLDPWWNPAVEDQAADRAHRIGQKDPVTVYRVVAADTVEERILDLHGEKRAVSEDLLESATGAPLSTERLMALFG